jgi:hypothetical protein
VKHGLVTGAIHFEDRSAEASGIPALPRSAVKVSRAVPETGQARRHSVGERGAESLSIWTDQVGPKLSKCGDAAYGPNQDFRLRRLTETDEAP